MSEGAIRTTDDAAGALLAGGLVLLPTETVYGLAGNADDPEALRRIYDVKGRPHDHPVIVHCADGDAALDSSRPTAWVSGVPDYARALAARFWPGPMTLVLPRTPRATDQVTGGQDTVAIRVPGHPMAQAVIAEMDARDPAHAPHGVAAPSANRFGRVSPTTVEHAIAEVGEALDADRDGALDGGPCEVGVESAIIDCTGSVPRILRHGGVSADDIRRVTGLDPEVGGDVRVPGSLPSHYAPRAEVVIVADREAAAALAAARVETGLAPQGIAFIGPAGVDLEGVERLAAPVTAQDYAHVLYAALRAADDRGIALVIAVPPDDHGLGTAVIDRLRRASAPRTA